MSISKITTLTKTMIDNLKTVCSSYGLGNGSSEYKIITEIFLYKYLNDKFLYEAKKTNPNLTTKELEDHLTNLSDDDYKLFLSSLGAHVAKFQKTHLISYLYNQKNIEKFHETFDTTLTSIADENIAIFSVRTGADAKMRLFESISQHISNYPDKDEFCRVVIDKLVDFSFEPVFELKYDFFATVFEYLLKDYNKDFGKYAEYYTPHTISSIIAKIMVPNGDKNVTVYDPAAGSGTLVLSLAHEIGEQNCTIYSQDISQKSSEFLRLNLILNNLVHSLPNVIQSDTLINPAHKNAKKDDLRKFNYIVSNPPFNTDFSAHRDTLSDENHSKRFFAGVPAIPNKEKDKMPTYLMFLQHILYSMDSKGKAAIVVPTGFLTAGAGIGKTLREYMIEQKMLRGIISMPSNIFATTPTSVSILFLDKNRQEKTALLMDASKLGTSIKEDSKNKKTVLSTEEIAKIITTFNSQSIEDDFSILVSYEDIINKKHSFSAGQYFDVKIEYATLSQDEFQKKMSSFTKNLSTYFGESDKLQKEIVSQLKKVKYD